MGGRAVRSREPLTDEVDVAIVGAGFGGLLTGARLRELGVDSVRLIDKAADVGGTWYWNRYPGIACDVESYVYMPLLEELGYIPSEKYAKGAEIFAHCRRIAEHYDLYRDACLQTEVHEIRWDDSDSRWIIRTNRGDQMRARFVSMANGYLQRSPSCPAFRASTRSAATPSTPAGGTTATPARTWRTWPTSASASSAPERPPSSACHTWRAAAQQLFVFQRTPSSVDVRANAPTDPQWAAGVAAGLAARRIENFQILTAGGQADEDLVADAWTSITRRLPVMRWDSDASVHPRATRARASNSRTSPRWRRSGRGSTRSSPIPPPPRRSNPGTGTSASGPAFTTTICRRSTATTSPWSTPTGSACERITESGVVVDGVHHELDCLIFATGFEVGTDYCRRSGFELIGRDGRDA